MLYHWTTNQNNESGNNNNAGRNNNNNNNNNSNNNNSNNNLGENNKENNMQNPNEKNNKSTLPSRDALMKEIMNYDFAIHELVLFLDVNPRDLKALEMYHALIEKREKLEEQCTNQYGPLTASQVKSKTTWTWTESPWPWEN